MMNERRIAVLVAGGGLTAVGVIVTMLPAGFLLGPLSVGAGLVLAVSAAAALYTHRHEPRDHAEREVTRGSEVVAIPRVSFWAWQGTTPWGTTPWGIAARAFTTAILTAAAALLVMLAEDRLRPIDASDLLPRVGETDWGSLAVRIVLILAIGTASLVPAWVIERVTKPRVLLPLRTDLTVVMPLIVGSVVTILAMTFGLPSAWGFVAAGAQAIVGVIVGFSLRSVPDS